MRQATFLMTMFQMMTSSFLAVAKISDILPENFPAGDARVVFECTQSPLPHLHDFAWQEGYGAFTVSKPNLEAVIGYIQKQREHHQQESFQEEYRKFLQKHGIDYDERYVWG